MLDEQPFGSRQSHRHTMLRHWFGKGTTIAGDGQGVGQVLQGQVIHAGGMELQQTAILSQQVANITRQLVHALGKHGCRRL